MMLLFAFCRAVIEARSVLSLAAVYALNNLFLHAGPAGAEAVELAELTELDGAFLTRFDAGAPFPEGWDISAYTVADDHHYQTAWARAAVVYNDQISVPMELWLRPAPADTPAATPDDIPADAGKPFWGGELQRSKQTHYGHYEVEMTAARGKGVISSFFTYTGPYFGDPHDEIDFEFLGRDTTKVWINRFARGQRLPGKWMDLGFDAAEGPHVYAIDWLPDRLIWSVDGQELFRIEAPDDAIPDLPGRIYINIWSGGPAQTDWLGKIAPNTQAVAAYHCISYRPIGEAAPSCSDPRLQTSND